ncbi:MAG: hypothetical protein JWM90_2646 [Thermoleophilia bacterium]|nr:hypothetical protein [Thermoleophilia bacterium]
MPKPPSLDDRVDAFADALYDLLQQRALSWGLVDIGMETDGSNIDCELLFGSDPDMGFSVDVSNGVARFCKLVGEDKEEWLDETLANLDILGAANDEELAARALDVANGVLAARRPLLPKSDWTPPAE